MSDCVCCDQGHPKSGATAKPGERWCWQCQKDGCPQPALLLDDTVAPACTVREHAGIEKVLYKIGIGAPLMPDPELGQDVALLCHVITTLQKAVDGKSGVTVNKQKLKDHLSKICDEASKELEGINPEQTMAKQYGARLRMAQELIQLIDAGESM